MRRDIILFIVLTLTLTASTWAESDPWGSGLVAHWPFDEGSGDMACDALDRSRCIQFFRTDDSIWVDGPAL